MKNGEQKMSNLRPPWANGQSANPGGPRRPLREAVLRRLTKPRANAIADKLISMAVAGDLDAIALLCKRGIIGSLIKDEIKSVATPEKIKKIVAKVMRMAEAGDSKAVKFLRLHLDGPMPRPSREDSQGKGDRTVLITGPPQLRPEPQSTSQTLPELPNKPE